MKTKDDIRFQPATLPNTMTKLAKEVRTGDTVISDGLRYTVRRIARATRKDWNHVQIYFCEGSSTCVRDTALLTVEAKMR